MEEILSEITSVSSRGQIFLPKKIRDQLQITPGTKIIVITDNKNILLKPIQVSDISEFKSLTDFAEQWSEITFNSKNDPALSEQVPLKGRVLGLGKGKFNSPADFDIDNEEIANLLMGSDL